MVRNLIVPLTDFRIYGQIGPGKRIAFSKLAVEHYEKYNRPLRLAIDVSIWHFQIQSGKGGSNPALRTLYYRLLRLLVLGVQPLFVFDGANKPPFKRNAKTGTQSASLPNYLTKQLLKFFGFPFHTAPGEAEAECALLQKEGVVDAVLSEDVDTLMFGCSMTLRSWTSEGTRGSKTPTHVTVYSADDAGIGEARLDSDGMILIALMSGGDYIPAGVPRCGIKVACEAARAGFGRDLCRLSKDDIVGFRQWRERLSYELETNESKLFRVKHKALRIPENFPNMAVLGYYTNPAVSSPDKLRRLASNISWSDEIDIQGLRKFVGEAFEWHNIAGAIKLIRGLAPALLVRRLCASGNLLEGRTDDDQEREIDPKIVTAICGRRIHFDTDGKPELRLLYTPAEIVGLDLQLEEKDGPTGNCSDSEVDQPEYVEPTEEVSDRPRTGGKLPYDPTQPERIWILEAYAKLGIPNMVDAWEEKLRNPKKVASRNSRKKADQAKIQERIDSFLKVSKTALTHPQEPRGSKQLDSAGSALGSQAPPLRRSPGAEMNKAVVGRPRRDKNDKRAVQEPQTPRKSGLPSPAASAEKNPWTLSKRPSDTFNVEVPRGSRYSALGIYETPRIEKHSDCGDEASPVKFPLTPSSQAKRKPSRPSSLDVEAIIISSSSESSPLSAAPESPTYPTRRLYLRKGTSTTPRLDTSPTSSLSSSLPSPSILLSPSAPPKTNSRHKDYLKPPPAPSESLTSPTKSKRKKTLVMLRESLDGAWRSAEPWEVEGSSHPKDVFRDVEVLDLTQS